MIRSGRNAAAYVCTRQRDWRRAAFRATVEPMNRSGERGHSRHPVRVACGRYSLSPDQARELASVLLRKAAEAEQ